MTQAEVIYTDEVHSICSGEAEEKVGEEEAKGVLGDPPHVRARGPEGGREGAGEGEDPLQGAAGGFFDPLLNRPPAMVEEDRRREAGHGPWAKEGAVVVVPLRLGLANLNPAYIPGERGALAFLTLNMCVCM